MSGKGSGAARLHRLLPWLLAALAVTLCVGARVTTPYVVSGDEPHYLVIAGSIVHDGDVDVKNDYQLGRYRSYYPDTIDPHVNLTIFNSASPHWYSFHEVGLPILLVPMFAIWGLAGAEATMILVALALLAVTYRWSLRVLGSRTLAMVSVAGLLISSSFLGLEGYVFPDLVVALLMVSSLLLLERSRNVAFQVLLGTMLGVAVWVHVRTVLMFLAVGLIALWQVLVRDRALGRRHVAVHTAALVVPPLLLAALFEIEVHQWFGSWNPTAMYQGSPSILQASPLHTIPRLLFGGTQGVFADNPVWILAAAGAGMWFARRRSQLLRVLAVTLPTFLLISTFAIWRGGGAPPGRFSLSILPAFAPAIGWAVEAARRPVARAAAAGVFALQALFTAIDYRTNGFPWGNDPVLGVLQQHLPFIPASWVPTFDAEVPPAVRLHDKVYVVAFALLLVALLVAGYVRGRETPAGTTKPPAGRPGALLLQRGGRA